MTDQSRADRVYEELKEEIESLALPPGTVLREVELAERFSVSRTPVRDALRWLEGEGLISSVGRRGTIVANVSYQEALQAYEIRELIEPFAAAQAARNTAFHAEIRRYLDRPDDAEGLSSAHARKTREDADREFHSLVARAAHNPLIGKVVADMRSRMRRVFISSNKDDYWLGKDQHDEILRAILAGDEAGAADAMRRHLVSARNRLMQMRP